VAEQEPSRPFPIISLIGGKWTTFRGFAEEVADTVLDRLGRARKVTTRSMPIGGGKDFPADTAARSRWLVNAASASGIDQARLDQLLSRYGTKASRIARHQSASSNEDRLPDSSDYSVSEIDYIARNEFVEHLADIVMRRTTLAISGSLTIGDLQQVAIVAGRALGWTPQRTSEEIDQVVTQLNGANLMGLQPERRAKLA
jgi:glycerol-3-phosphate dehydrogenase